MARKSNKTDHVLSLLSSGGKDKTDEKSTAPKPPVEPDMGKEKKESKVSIVQSSPEKEGLADTIKKSLEDELVKMIPDDVSDQEVAEEKTEAEKLDEMLKAEPVVEPEPKLEIQIEPEVMESQTSVPDEVELSKIVASEETAGQQTPVIKETVEMQTEASGETGENQAAASGEAVKSQAEVTDETSAKLSGTKENAPVQQAVVETPVQNNSAGSQESEREFAYINVMERLVREKVMDYMEQFGNCTCSRCVADTMALALTQLPPKYVVINKETVSPLMNFYTQKYAGQITVEITKACIRVGETPHHSRD